MVDTTSSTPVRQWADAPPDSDEALLAEFRAGHDWAFAELYERHHRTAVGVARHVVGRGSAADDVVAEAFTSLLTAVRRGGGPSSNVRSYLLTTVRNTAIGFLRAQQKSVPVETEVVDRPHHDPDGLVAADDDRRVRRAFAELPARWRRVLWYVDVHDLPPAQVGPLLGVSPNAVSSLARRARERLRREYLQAHQDRVAPGCEDYAPHLARYVDETLAVPVHHRVDVHVQECVYCAAAVDQMRDLKRRMRAVLLPLGLPLAAAGELDEPRDDDSHADVSLPRAGLRRARAVGRRWWWARPRIGARTAFLAAVAVAVCLLLLFTVTASGIVGRGPAPVGPAADGAPTPDAGELVPDPGQDDAVTEQDDLVESDPVPGGGVPSPSPWPGDHRGEPADDPDYTDELPAVWGGPVDSPAVVVPAPTPGESPGPGVRPGPPSEPDPEPEPSPSADPEPTPAPDPAVVQIAYDDLGDLVPGRQGVLGAAVTNPNAEPVGTVTVDVTLPAGVELDTAGGARAVSGWTCAASVDGLACVIDTVAAGGTSTLLVPVLVGADVPVGTADVRLDVRGDGVVPAGTDVTVPVSDSPLAARYVATGPAEVALVGAPVLHCDPAVAGCAAVTDGTATGAAQNNNGWNMVTIDALGTGTASSTARLDLPAGSEVLAARLYWSGACSGDVFPVRLAPPGSALVDVAGPLTVDRRGQRYQASADVTDLVRSGGAGTWGVADVCVTEGTAQNAGWALAVVHRPVGAGAEGSGLAIVYDGLMAVVPADPPTFAVAGRPGTAARIGAVAWDGDRANASDRLTLDGVPLVPRLWDGAAAAGPGSATNAFDSTAWGSAYANALGVDAKPFEPASLAAPRADLVAQGDADQYTLGVVTVATGS